MFITVFGLLYSFHMKNNPASSLTAAAHAHTGQAPFAVRPSGPGPGKLPQLSGEALKVCSRSPLQQVISALSKFPEQSTYLRSGEQNAQH